MTETEAVRKLLQDCKAADAGSRELDCRIHQLVAPDQPFMYDPGSVRPPKRDAQYMPLSEVDLSRWHDWDGLALFIQAPYYTTFLDHALRLVPPVWAPRIDFDERPQAYLYRRGKGTISGKPHLWVYYADAATAPLAVVQVAIRSWTGRRG